MYSIHKNYIMFKREIFIKKILPIQKKVLLTNVCLFII